MVGKDRAVTVPEIARVVQISEGIVRHRLNGLREYGFARETSSWPRGWFLTEKGAEHLGSSAPSPTAAAAAPTLIRSIRGVPVEVRPRNPLQKPEIVEIVTSGEVELEAVGVPLSVCGKPA